MKARICFHLDLKFLNNAATAGAPLARLSSINCLQKAVAKNRRREEKKKKRSLYSSGSVKTTTLDMAAVDNSTSDSSNAVESNSASANINFSSRSNNTTDPDFDIYAGDNEFAEVNLFIHTHCLIFSSHLSQLIFNHHLFIQFRNTRHALMVPIYTTM